MKTYIRRVKVLWYYFWGICALNIIRKYKYYSTCMIKSARLDTEHWWWETTEPAAGQEE